MNNPYVVSATMLTPNTVAANPRQFRILRLIGSATSPATTAPATGPRDPLRKATAIPRATSPQRSSRQTNAIPPKLNNVAMSATVAPVVPMANGLVSPANCR